MKHLLLGAIAVSTLMSSAAFAQSNQNRNDGRDNDRNRGESSQGRYDNDRGDRNERSWKRGERLSRDYYRDNRYSHYGWRDSGLRAPPRGHQWMLIGTQFVLISMRDGRIIEIAAVPRRGEGRGYGYGGDRNEQWRARYKRTYTYNDDVAYTECRSRGADPAGVLAGAVIGGLLGNAVAGRGDRGGATVAGVIAGGALGVALTAKLDCSDRSYAYKSYSDGFNGGRAGATYRWENPQNRHRGEMRVIDYYNDEDRFRCAVFTQTVYIGNRPEEARGRACQQPDGTWAIID
jgi:Ni/Co efflux regulator RcnB/surface antigen